MGRPVIHFGITGRDGTALQDFYANLFEWSIQTDNPFNYGFVDTGSDEGVNGSVGQTAELPGVTVFVAINHI